MFFKDVFTPHGSMVLNNFGGIEIEISSCGEGVRWRYHWGEEPTDEPTEVEIEYQNDPDQEGEDLEPCFVVGSGENQTTYFLSNFMAYR